jgi:hypothetical protein
MTVITDFDIATDLQVYLYSWDNDNAFIINFSQLGGTNVLATAALEPVQIECEVAEANIQTGITAESPYSFSPFSSELQLRLRGTNFDAFTNPNIILGRKVGLYLKDDLDQNIPLFVGYITAYNFDYIPGEAVGLSIIANDFWYYIGSYNIDRNNSNKTRTDEKIDLILEDFRAPLETAAPDVNGDAEYVLWIGNPSFREYQGNAGDIINKFMRGEQGFLFCSPGDFLSATPSRQRDNIIATTSETVNSLLYGAEPISARLGHNNTFLNLDRIVFDTSGTLGYCPSLINFDSNITDIVNEVYVSNTDNSALFVRLVDTESQLRYGTNAVVDDFTFNGTQYLTTWAQYAVASGTRPVIRSLQVPAITRSGDLDIPGLDSGLPIGQPARVVIDFNGATIDSTYIITKTTHSITPDTWMIDYSLWTRPEMEFNLA